MNATDNDEYVKDAVDKAVKIATKQLENPDVYDSNTLNALSEISALAAFLRQRAAEASVAGERSVSGYYKGYVESLQFIIDSIKYKIKVNQENKWNA